jgi:uncharacterized membrane protein YphA (DoxX/SURF4 family)
LNDNKITLGTGAMVVLALLRLALGWHFFMEGAKKFHDPDFTSANLFYAARGPLKNLYLSQLNDPYGDWRLMSDLEAKALEAEGDKPHTMADQWYDDLSAAYAHYGFTQEQEVAGQQVYDRANEQLQKLLADNKEEIVEYFRELKRLEEDRQRPIAHSVPFEAKRLDDKEKELRKKMLGWSNKMKDIGRDLQDDVYGIADGNQQARGKYLFRNPGALVIDRIVPWVLVIAGMLLLTGFLTPLGSALACIFLLGVMGTQPPWVPGADPIYNQVVEFLALLVVAFTGAGRCAGLDYFVQMAIDRCCPPAEEQPHAT